MEYFVLALVAIKNTEAAIAFELTALHDRNLEVTVCLSHYTAAAESNTANKPCRYH